MRRETKRAGLIRDYRENILYFIEREGQLEISDPNQVDYWTRFADPTQILLHLLMFSAAGTGKTTAVAGSLCYSMVVFKSFYMQYSVKGVCVGIGEKNIKRNLWGEVEAFYKKSALMKEEFELKNGIFRPKNKDEDWRNWNIDTLTLPKTGTSSSAGDHGAGLHATHVFTFVDESEGVNKLAGNKLRQIFKAKNVIMARLVETANPTCAESMAGDTWKRWENSGGKKRNLYAMRITGDPDDPMCSTLVNKEENAEIIKDAGGREAAMKNAWIRSSVYALLPLHDINNLLSEEEVDKCMDNFYGITEESQKDCNVVISIDVADGEGAGDESVITVRQGLYMYEQFRSKDLDEVQLGGKGAYFWHRYKGDYMTVDGTGGIGKLTVNTLHNLGIPALRLIVNKTAQDADGYDNIRSEMADRQCRMIKGGMRMPKCATLRRQLLTLSKTVKGSKMILVPKPQQKKLLEGNSPDCSDSMGYSYFNPEMMRDGTMGQSYENTKPYDPTGESEMDKIMYG